MDIDEIKSFRKYANNSMITGIMKFTANSDTVSKSAIQYSLSQIEKKAVGVYTLYDSNKKKYL